MTDYAPLKIAAKGLRAILDQAKNLASSDLDSLSERPGSVFCPAIKIYSDLLNSLAFEDFDQLEDQLKKDPKAEEFADELWATEDAWDELLSFIDEKLNFGINSKASYIGARPPLEADLYLPEEPLKCFKLEDVLANFKGFKVHLVLLRHLS